MLEIECVRMTKSNPLLDEYLSKLVKEVDCKAKLIDWENLKTASNGSAIILIVESDHLESLKNLLANRNGKVIIALNSRKDFKIVSELKSHFSNIFGFVDLSLEMDYNIPILKNYLNSGFTKNAVKIDQLASDLDKIYEFTKSELTRVKELHDRFVKLRVDQFKSAALISKFMAGEKSGGEFFDIIQNEQDVYFIQAGSNSYLLSSVILAEIEHLREKSNVSNFQDHLEKFLAIINHHAKENKAELSYCVMDLNLKTLQTSFSLKGAGHVFYQGDLITFNEPIKLKLKPKDKLYIISEGAMRNWEFLSKIPAKKFFNDNQMMNTKDLINEFFFELSRNKNGSFLIYDAFMAAVEIEENFLYQLS